MKKILFLLLLSVSFMSCSSDDEANVFDSHILLNGNEFIPDQNDDGDHFDMDGVLVHAVADTLEGHAKARTFLLSRYDGPHGYTPTIVITIFYPNEQATINGTYSFLPADSEAYRYPVGQIRDAQGYMVGLNDGSVTVTSMGSNHYKLEFNEVKGNFTSIPFDFVTTLEGYFDGTFKNF